MIIFPNALEARNGSINNVMIHDEIREIENQILVAISLGLLTVEITSSPMTNDISYYEVFMGIAEDLNKKYQMQRVKEYFESLKYSIKQTINTPSSFKWEIYW